MFLHAGCFVALSAAALAITSSRVHAQASADVYDSGYRTIRVVRPEFHLSLGGHGDFGAGLRLDIPIVPRGFLTNRRDELALSPGVDLQFLDFSENPDDDDGLLVVSQLAIQWNFYLRRGWSIFPELGLALVVGDDHHDYSGDDGTGVHADGLIAFGVRRHFSERAAILLRAGWPNGLQLGFTI